MFVNAQHVKTTTVQTLKTLIYLDFIFYKFLILLSYKYDHYQCNDHSCVLYAVYFNLFVLFGFTAY